MNAAVLKDLRVPRPGEDIVTLDLVTQTPLYTGGIGQWGDQIHPSGLLGSIRYFSCLVARTLGDARFEPAVWGSAGDGTNKPHAKAVGLRWETAALRTIDLPPKLSFKREDTQKDRGWYYNQARQGRLALTLTRREIDDEHWNLLLLALRVQIRHATFGAKDQFGLGVLACASLPKVKPLDEQRVYPSVSGFHLQRCAFGRLTLSPAAGNREELTPREGLRLGLECRIALRDCLRPDPATLAAPLNRWDWKALRHRLMGALNEYGSAINVSAAHPVQPGGREGEIRLFIQLRLDDSTQRTEVMKRLTTALKQLDPRGWSPTLAPWEYGGSYGGHKHPAKWLNKLAGL